MSPSEEKGLALGLHMARFDRHRATTATPGGIVFTRVFAVFEAPLIATTSSGDRRHTLKVFAKSRAGAWRVAVRWLRQLSNGKLK